MKKILLLLTFLTTLKICVGQQKEYSHQDPNGFTHIDTTINNNYVLSLLEMDKGKTLASYVIVDMKDCISQGLYKPKEEALKLYGRKNIVEIKLKPGVEAIGLDEILKSFTISPKDRSLPVFVDKHQVLHPEKLYAVKSMIVSVKVLTNPENKERLISIITKEYNENDKTIHIR